MLKLYRIVRRVRINEEYLDPQERLRLGEWAELFLYGTAVLTFLFFVIIRIVIVFLAPEDAVILSESEGQTYRDIVLSFLNGSRIELGWNHYIAISLYTLGIIFFVTFIVLLMIKLTVALYNRYSRERSFRRGKRMILLGKEKSVNMKFLWLFAFLSGFFHYISQIFLYWY